MRSADKQAAMAAFASGAADVLVATTVIEVGIDVPNATVMLVEDAERYGISQLHQLRGRIGRGPHPSLCLLFGEKSSPRLQAVAGHSDGFKLAEIDLRLRGEGELVGTRQSGIAGFRVAELPRDADLLDRAAECARRVISEDPDLELPEHALLATALERSLGEEGRGADPGVRVVGGTLGGRTLRAPRGRATRPTSDPGPAKPSSLDPRRCGRGDRARPVRGVRHAMAIEAISRGAGQATLVDSSAPPAIAVIRRNLEALGIDAELLHQRALQFLGNARTHARQYDLVFLDPPYSQAAALGPELSRALVPVLAPGGRVVVESDPRAPLRLGLTAASDERRYGDTLIEIFHLPDQAQPR